jgi:hypothetical protein
MQRTSARRILVAAALTCAPLAAQQAVSWTMALEHRIGAVDGPAAYVFSPPLSLAAAADGMLYVLDHGQQEVRVFDGRGRHVRTFGGEGAGPGEFLGATRIGWRGDSLWVADPVQLRVTWFGRDGRVLRTDGPAMRAAQGYAPAVPQAVLADGSSLVIPSMLEAGVDAPSPARVPILRIPSGGRADTLAWQTLRNRMLRFGMGGRYMSLVQPWDDSPLVAAAPDGSAVIFVERAAATRRDEGFFRVTRLNARGDTVYSRQFRYVPVAVPSGWRGQWTGDMAARIAKPGSGLQPRDVAAAMDRALYVPGFMPPITDVVAGRDGSVWIRREQPGATATWHVLDARGLIEANVRMPGDLQLAEARRTNVWGVTYDSLEVPYVHRYRVTPPPRQ